MADAGFPVALRDLAIWLAKYVPAGCRSSVVELLNKSAAETERLKTEIERLTPKPMTRRHVAAVLNRHSFQGHTNWFASHLSPSFYLEVDHKNVFLDEYSAFAVAEKLEREQEAARA